MGSYSIYLTYNFNSEVIPHLILGEVYYLVNRPPTKAGRLHGTHERPAVVLEYQMYHNKDRTQA